jgi:uncharacterized protein YjbI with pentapeptide repeats
MKCHIPDCDENAITLSEYCWAHIPDKKQYTTGLLSAIDSGKSFAKANLKKVVLRDVHIEKADFEETNLAMADLSGSHLFDARMRGAELIGVNLSNCDLTHCDLGGSDLTRAKLSGARLWNATLTNANLTESDLSFADFWNAKLFNVKLWHACFGGAKSLTKSNFSLSVKPFDTAKIDETGGLSAEESYRDLKQYFMSCGRYNDASWASFREKTMERIVMKKKRDLNYLPSLFMSLICGYGEKLYRIVLAALSTILIFAFLYHHFDTMESSVVKDYVPVWSDYIYYSTITFTTVGYGDFIPKCNGVFRLLSALEAFMGVFLSGLFIFTLARKYSAR